MRNETVESLSPYFNDIGSDLRVNSSAVTIETRQPFKKIKNGPSIDSNEENHKKWIEGREEGDSTAGDRRKAGMSKIHEKSK